MTSFLNGPAVGQTLALKRAPVMLRAVRANNGKWDALDQLGDEPKPHETIHVYRLAKKPWMIHMRCSGKGGKAASGFWPVAEYVYLEQQPGDEHTRDNAAWVAWCDLRLAGCTNFETAIETLQATERS